MKDHASSYDGQLLPVLYCLKKVQANTKKKLDYPMKDRAISYDGQLIPAYYCIIKLQARW